MKRILVFILALFYLATATGTSLHFHYCMGKLAGWSVWETTEDDACGKCGMEKNEKPDGCCNDEHVFIKLQDDQKVSGFVNNLPPPQFTVATSYLQFENPVFVSEGAKLISNSHGPPKTSINIYKRNCVFRI